MNDRTAENEIRMKKKEFDIYHKLWYYILNALLR